MATRPVGYRESPRGFGVYQAQESGPDTSHDGKTREIRRAATERRFFTTKTPRHEGNTKNKNLDREQRSEAIVCACVLPPHSSASSC
jgi:hypothetical protein